MINPDIGIPMNRVIDFCQRWHIIELALFGSALREDFGPESDLDLLVTFTPDTKWGLLDHLRMEQELTALSGRKIDLITKDAVERSHNRLLRQAILSTAEVLYGP